MDDRMRAMGKNSAAPRSCRSGCCSSTPAIARWPMVQTIFAFRMLLFFCLDKIGPAHHLVRMR